MEKTFFIIIVNYQKTTRLIESVSKLLQQSGVREMTIVVCDNSDNEEDWSRLQCLAPTCHLVRSPGNIGYTKAVNLCMTRYKAGHVLLVSPDVCADNPTVLDTMSVFLHENSEVGLVSPMQINDDGSIVEVARSFPTFYHMIKRKIVSNFRNSDIDLNSAISSDLKEHRIVDWLQSSFLLIRSSIVDSNKVLNEKYFLFMADVELSARVRDQHGLYSALLLNCKVRADGKRLSGGGVFRLITAKAGRAHIRDGLRYFLGI